MAVVVQFLAWISRDILRLKKVDSIAWLCQPATLTANLVHISPHLSFWLGKPYSLLNGHEDGVPPSTPDGDEGVEVCIWSMSTERPAS
jgi:hypothetical protein